jgi:hypothetical protein
MTKHVAIVGARGRTDRERIDRLVASLPADVVIVSGGQAERKAPTHGPKRPHASAGSRSKYFTPTSLEPKAKAQSPGAITSATSKS